MVNVTWKSVDGDIFEKELKNVSAAKEFIADMFLTGDLFSFKDAQILYNN